MTAIKKDTFDYPSEDLLNPLGKNSLSTRSLFYQRALYKEKIYPSSRPAPLDTWYDRYLYGRVDRVQDTIIPKSITLKTISSADAPNLMALNVVTHAFEKFHNHMQKAIWASAVDTNANPALINISAVRAYESPSLAYDYHLQALYNAFASNITGAESSRIKNYKDFQELFARYLLTVAPHQPVTATNFFLTDGSTVFSTGIAIAISKGDAGNDSKKYEKFINDPNFEFYRSCAKKFGFIVDKNIPWILTADLFSSALEEVALSQFVNAAGDRINRDNFFDNFFKKTHLTDIEYISNMIMNGYKIFVARSPYYEDLGAKIRVKGGSSGAHTDVTNLMGGCAPMRLERAPQQPPISDKFLIDLYINLRQAEVGHVLKQHDLRSIRMKAYEVYDVRPEGDLTALQNVAVYVQRIFRNHIYDLGSLKLQIENAETLDNRARGGKIVTTNNIGRQLY